MISLSGVFHSGCNLPGDMEGALRAGYHVGVSASDIRPPGIRAACELAQVHTEQMMFVDSGAFGEVEFSPLERRFVVKKPITDWRHRLDVYEEIAEAWGRRTMLVCPDLVGDQQGTLERLDRYSTRMQHLADYYGARLIVPLQGGRMDMVDFGLAARQIMDGHPRMVWGIPSKKAATHPRDLAAFAKGVGAAEDAYIKETGQQPMPAWFHLLGCAPSMGDVLGGVDYLGLLAAIRQHLPDAVVTCDSVRMRGLVGRTNGKGGSVNVLTAAQDRARAAGVRGSRAVKAAAAEAVYRAELEGRAALDAWLEGLTQGVHAPAPPALRPPRRPPPPSKKTPPANQLALF